MWNSSLPSSTFTFGYLVLSIKPPLINCALYYFLLPVEIFNMFFVKKKNHLKSKEVCCLVVQKTFRYIFIEWIWRGWNLLTCFLSFMLKFSNNSLISTGTHNDPVYWISRPYICIVYTLFNGKRRPRYAFSKLCSGSVVGCGKHFITKPFFQL